MARTRLSPEEQKLLIERQKEERLRRLQERNQAGLLNPRARRANPEVANTNLLDSSVTNVNANMTPIPAGLLQRGVEGANNPYTPSYSHSDIVNDPRLKSAMENVYKPTMRERVGGFFNRANQSFQNAAPIFAVAQEFRKAGAPRAVGAPMQGDPYGKMLQIQQGRQQAENLANLRQDEKYKKFANLPDKQFLEAVNEQIKFDIENKLNVTPNETIQKSRENAVVSEETEEALGRAKSAFGITDTFREKLGAVGEYVPFRERTFAPKTQAARQAVRMNVTKTKQFFLTDFAGRVAKYTAETINNILPMRFDAGSSQMTGFKSESFAQNSYENLKSEVERIVSVAESTLQNPNTTNKEKSDARSALNTGNQLIKEYDVILESLSGEREGTNENAGTTKRLYDTTQYNNQEPIENVRERFYTGGGLQIIAESRGLK
jgi:hypothetical protein